MHTAKGWKAWMFRQEIVILLFTVLLFIVFSAVSANFSAPANLKLILSQITINGICAIGVSLVILLGGIDLSAGSILALTAASAGMIINSDVPVLLTILASILIGACCGAFNGLLVTQWSLPPIIATLATMSLFRGLAIAVTGGDWIRDFPTSFNFLGQGRLLGISVPFWIFLLIALSMSWFLKYHSFGRKIYAVGGNMDGAKLAGLKVSTVRFWAYVASGGIIGLAGAVYASMVGKISASTTGASLVFQILAAALIGGMSINGGKGTILGAAIGVMMMGVIRNGLILAQVSEYWIDAITGLAILVALALSVMKQVKRRVS